MTWKEGSPIEQTVFYLIGQYGYLALFLSLVLGIVGLPIPDEVIMTYAGFLVSKGIMHFSGALFVSFLGSVIGMSISYSLGRFFGFPLIRKYGEKLRITNSRWERVKEWYAKFGPFVLMIGYFLPGIRHLTAFSAGASRMGITSFMLYAYSGGLIWALTFLSLGRVMGDHWRLLYVCMHHYRFWILAVLVLSAGTILYFRIKKGLN